MRKIIATLAIAIAASQASAEFWNGNTLKEHLESEDPARWGMAYGYIMGVADAHNGVKYCAPGSVKLGQMIDMVRALLIRGANMRHNVSGDVFVLAALEAAFPCNKSSESNPRSGNSL